jgi:hypothetical protein
MDAGPSPAIEDRGVSAKFLREFTDDLLAELGKAEQEYEHGWGTKDYRKSSYRLDADNIPTEHKIQADLWTKEVVECFIKPRTKQEGPLYQQYGSEDRGIRYVDLVRRTRSDHVELVGKASHFVSHEWGGPGRATEQDGPETNPPPCPAHRPCRR